MNRSQLNTMLSAFCYCTISLAGLPLCAQEAAGTAPSVRETLHELDWMVGSWTAKHGNVDIELTVDRKNAYLFQRYVARREGEVVRRSTQRIAWDGAARRPRSWTFNADGSFSEANWHQKDDVWVAESTGVNVDGGRTKAVLLWAPEGVDEFWFKSVQGAIDDQPVDDLVLKFSRRHAENPAGSPAVSDNNQR